MDIECFIITHMEEMEEIKRIALNALEKAEETMSKIKGLESREDNLENRMTVIEKRVDALDGKMDTLLDSTCQIKMLLVDNTSVTKSAKRNAKTWGVLSVAVSFFMRLIEIFI